MDHSLSLKGGIMPIEEEVKKTLEKSINDLGFVLAGITYKKENKDYVLRICIDREGPISLDDIVKVSDIVSNLLDVKDLIKESYMLDVTTLGIEKPLKIDSLEKYVGEYVNIHLSHPYKGLNRLEGLIESVSDGILNLSYKEKTRNIKANINIKDIDKAHIAIKL